MSSNKGYEGNNDKLPTSVSCILIGSSKEINVVTHIHTIQNKYI